MAALTLAQLQLYTRDLVGDPSNSGTGANTYTDQQVTDAINFACQDICNKLNFTYKSQDITATTPFQSYDLTTLAQDYVKIRRVALKDTSTTPVSYTELLKSTYGEEDLRNPAWLQLTCTPPTTLPRRWVLVDGKTIYVVPRPTAAYPAAGTTVTITVGYVQQPTVLVNTTDTVDTRIPWPVQIYLKYAAASWLKQFSGQDTQDLQQANEWMQQFNNYIGYQGEV